MSPESSDQSTVRIARALSDATRFGIFRAIASVDELSCSELVKRFPIAQPTVSHHTKVLADAGLISVRKEGQHSFFRANRATVDAYGSALSAAFSPGSDG